MTTPKLTDYTDIGIAKFVINNGVTRLDHHRCGACNHMVAYVFEGGDVGFDPSCDCSSYYSGYSSIQPSSYYEIANWFAMQSSDEIRAKMAEGFHFAT